MIGIDQLSTATRRALESYVNAATSSLEPDIAEAVACDLRSWALDHLDPASTPEDVAELARQAGTTSDDAAADVESGGPFSGRVFGVPFNLRLPTPAALTQSLWDPEDPRLWRPRRFGGGWDLNFGALAVRLGMIEPDAEAEPFASTPPSAFRLAAAVPAVAAAAAVAHYVFRWRTLPARMPSHWGWDGSADRHTTRGRAATADIALTVGPALVAAATARSQRGGAARAGVVALCAAVSASTAGITVWRSLPERRRPLAGLMVAKAGILATGGTLVGLARAGRAAEIRTDLEGAADGR